MSLKKLAAFEDFNGKKFFKDKILMLQRVEEWVDGTGDNAKVLGTKLYASICIDNTQYGNEKGINFGIQIVVKVSKPVSDFEDWKLFKSYFRLTEFTKVTVYGDFRNQLSVKVPSVERIQGKAEEAANNAAAIK